MLSCRFKAVPAKERKALFNTFCANAVEERTKVEAEAKEHAVRGLHELFAELLGVTPLQFRLFREGKDLVDVELEVAAETQRRAETLAPFVAEEAEEGEEKEEGEAGLAGEEGGPPRPPAEAATLAADALEADLEMVAGGLFVPGMAVDGVGEMVPKDPRWLEADGETRREVFEEVVAPVVRAREAAEEALEERTAPELRAWLEGACESADAEWERTDACRSGVVALLPQRLARRAFDKHVEGMRNRQVRHPHCGIWSVVVQSRQLS